MKAFIEIAKGSRNKYEVDKDTNELVLDRVLPEGVKYPYNYGFIPDTLSEDGDPLDIFIISDEPLVPGSYVNVELLGYINTRDHYGRDPKLIAKIKEDPDYFGYEATDSLVKEIKDFMISYKTLENSFIEVKKFYGKDKAIEELEKSKRLKIKGIR